MQTLANDFSITPLSEIKPYAGNSRKHSARQVEKIAASIVEFGFNAPILIDADGTIVAGHGRYLAAQRLNLEAVPTVQLGHLSEAKRKAYIIADNRIAEDAAWDMTKLALEVQSLQMEGMDLASTGLDDVDMTRLDMEMRRMAADLEIIEDPSIYAPSRTEPPAQIQQPAQAHSNLEDDLPAHAPIQHQAYQAPLAEPYRAPVVPFNVMLTAEQRDVVIRALNDVKAARGLMTLGEALHAICLNSGGQ